MLLDLENVRARIVLTADDRMRLTLEYPCQPVYRERVLAALSELIRPLAPQSEPVAPEEDAPCHDERAPSL